MTHTPGPWYVADREDGYPIVFYMRDGKDHAVCACGEGFTINTPHSADEKFANARLIAAAPDAHKANIQTLQYINAIVDNWEEWGVSKIHDHLSYLQQINAEAIAKAESA